MVMIPFAKWRPDAYNLNSPFASEVKGVLPGINSKTPWPSLAVYTDALPSACRGAILCRDATGAVQIFAGTATKLYKLKSDDLTWTDVTRLDGAGPALLDYTVGDNERWQFAVFGANLYATQIGDALQSINMESGTNFADVSGSPPQARYIRVIGDQIFLGSTTSQGNRIHWCGRNAPTFWTAGGGQDCDVQDFPDGGFVRGIVGVTSGLIFQDECVRAFTPSDGREIYRFVKVDETTGLYAPDSVVTHQATTFYLSTDGLMSVGPEGVRHIGLENVDDWLFATSDQDRLTLMQGAVDPNRPRIFWSFPNAGSSGYTLNHILCYDIALQEWTHAEIENQFVMPAATTGYTLEGLDAIFPDLDAMSISLDSRAFSGGAPAFAAFNSDNKLCFFNGAAVEAVVATAEFQAIPGRRAFVRGIRPYTDASNISVRVATRQTQAMTELPSYRSSVTLNGRGWAPTRASGRYHIIEATIPAGEDWTHLQGVEPEVAVEGKR